MKAINRIETCGNIGTGKTTLVRAVERQLNIRAVFEDFSSIHWLSDFYQNPQKYAFETEFAFTLLHYNQLKTSSESGKTIADFSLIDDYAFAVTTLSPEGLSVYEKMFDYILDDIGFPSKMVYLTASIPTLLTRISHRGRTSENSISSAYLSLVGNNILYAMKTKFASVETITLDTQKVSTSSYSESFLRELFYR